MLGAYLTQVFAPLYACDLETSPANHHNGFMNPLQSWQENIYAVPKNLPQTGSASRQEAIGCKPGSDPVDQAFGGYGYSKVDYAALYQYRLEIQTLGMSGHTLSLSRKFKDPQGQLALQFETLHTATIQEEKLTAMFRDQKNDPADMMLKAFKSASLKTLEREGQLTGYSWMVPGFGSVKVCIDGTVIFDQCTNSSAFSPYDLIFKTSGDLHIQTMTMAGLKLQSPKTFFNGAASIGYLRINRNASMVNNCGMGEQPGHLQINQVTNTGSILNKGVEKVGKECKKRR